MAPSGAGDPKADLAPLVPELTCSDFTASLAFYVDTLGFRVHYARPEEQFAYLEREGAQIMIEQPLDRAWITGPLEQPYGRGINLQIGVTDAEALYARCRSAGTPIFMEMEEAWYRRGNVLLGCRQFLVLDPDGYLLRLQQDIGTRPIEGARPQGET